MSLADDIEFDLREKGVAVLRVSTQGSGDQFAAVLDDEDGHIVLVQLKKDDLHLVVNVSSPTDFVGQVMSHHDDVEIRF